MKYNINDKVKIIKRLHGHEFKIGTIVTIEKNRLDDYLAINKSGEFWWICDDEITSTKSNKMKNTQTIKQVANALLKANNTVTTLELKVELRKKYPSQKWKQSDISQAMNDLYLQGLYTYTDNGTYRVYSAVAAPVAKTVVSGRKASTQKVSRTKALELIQKNGGRFFDVTFTKKDGTTREMKCRIEKHNTKPTNFGYLLVLDVEDNTPKSLNLQTVSELRMNKNVYKVA